MLLSQLYHLNTKGPCNLLGINYCVNYSHYYGLYCTILSGCIHTGDCPNYCYYNPQNSSRNHSRNSLRLRNRRSESSFTLKSTQLICSLCEQPLKLTSCVVLARTYSSHLFLIAMRPAVGLNPLPPRPRAAEGNAKANLLQDCLIETPICCSNRVAAKSKENFCRRVHFNSVWMNLRCSEENLSLEKRSIQTKETHPWVYIIAPSLSRTMYLPLHPCHQYFPGSAPFPHSVSQLSALFKLSSGVGHATKQ